MSDVLARLTSSLADRYRVERELGAGGMATVCLAHDHTHEREVTIKVLHPDLGAARRGETRRDRLTRERQLPLDHARRIAGAVGNALQYAHAQGGILRAIKPENILRQDGHALVADFGIALAVQTAGGARMTQTDHLHRLQTVYDEHFARAYGPWRPVVTQVADTSLTARVTEAFRRAVLRLVVRLALFDEDQAAGRRTWPHSGFPVHTAVWEGPFGSPRTIARSRPDSLGDRPDGDRPDPHPPLDPRRP